MASEEPFGPAPGTRPTWPWRSLARRLREYALLMRLDRPIGTLLLLWPVLWGLWIAGDGRPDERVFVIFMLGVFAMRAAGCVINDYADRDLDPHVRRTRDRPLAARRVTPVEALLLFTALMTVAFLLALQLDAYTLRLAFIGAALTATYPFVKRFFPLPQLYLGLSFGGFGVLMAFAAELGSLPRMAWLVYFSAVLWAVIYDTQYAMVDRADDERIGVHSSALLFGDMDRTVLGAMQVMMLLGLWLAGRSLLLGGWYHAGLAFAAVLFAWQQWLIRERAPADCFRAFLSNNYVGMVIFAGIALEYLFNA